MLEALGHALRIGAERVRRAELDDAVRPALDRHVLRSKLERATGTIHGAQCKARRLVRISPGQGGANETPSIQQGARRDARAFRFSGPGEGPVAEAEGRGDPAAL